MKEFEYNDGYLRFVPLKDMFFEVQMKKGAFTAERTLSPLGVIELRDYLSQQIELQTNNKDMETTSQSYTVERFLQDLGQTPVGAGINITPELSCSLYGNIQNLVAENEKLKQENNRIANDAKIAQSNYNIWANPLKDEIKELKRQRSAILTCDNEQNARIEGYRRENERLKGESENNKNKFLEQLQLNDVLRNENAKLRIDTQCIGKYKEIGKLIPAKDGESHFVTMQDFIKSALASQRQSGIYKVKMSDDQEPTFAMWNKEEKYWSICGNGHRFGDVIFSYISPAPIDLGE